MLCSLTINYVTHIVTHRKTSSLLDPSAYIPMIEKCLQIIPKAYMKGNKFNEEIIIKYSI